MIWTSFCSITLNDTKLTYTYSSLATVAGETNLLDLYFSVSFKQKTSMMFLLIRNTLHWITEVITHFVKMGSRIIEWS